MNKIFGSIRQALNSFRKLQYLLNPRIKFGKRVYIGSNVRINTEGEGSINIGDNCEINESVKLFARAGVISIGDNCVIDDHVSIAAQEEDITIGNDCYVNSFCFINGRGGLKIGDNVGIGPQTIIITANHIFSDKNVSISSQGYEKKKVIIEDDVWIGAGCRILCGVKIGKGAVVGAGTVATKNLEAFGVYAGVPAKLLRER